MEAPTRHDASVGRAKILLALDMKEEGRVIALLFRHSIDGWWKKEKYFFPLLVCIFAVESPSTRRSFEVAESLFWGQLSRSWGNQRPRSRPKIFSTFYSSLYSAFLSARIVAFPLFSLSYYYSSFISFRENWRFRRPREKKRDGDKKDFSHRFSALLNSAILISHFFPSSARKELKKSKKAIFSPFLLLL